MLSLIMCENEDFFDIMSEDTNINDTQLFSVESKKSIIAILDDSRIQEHKSTLSCYRIEVVSLLDLIEEILEKEV